MQVFVVEYPERLFTNQIVMIVQGHQECTDTGFLVKLCQSIECRDQGVVVVVVDHRGVDECCFQRIDILFACRQVLDDRGGRGPHKSILVKQMLTSDLSEIGRLKGGKCAQHIRQCHDRQQAVGRPVL